MQHMMLYFSFPRPSVIKLPRLSFLFHLHAHGYLLYSLPRYNCCATVEEQTIPEDVPAVNTVFSWDAALRLCQGLQRSHTLSECMRLLPLSANVFAVGSELEECIVVVDQSAVISFKPFLSPLCSMAYSAFIWITSENKTGQSRSRNQSVFFLSSCVEKC